VPIEKNVYDGDFFLVGGNNLVLSRVNKI